MWGSYDGELGVQAVRNSPRIARPAGGRFSVHVVRRNSMRAKRLTIQQRQEIFHALVTTQDMGIMTVPQSRQHVTRQFDITEAQVRQIEEEGLEKEWPPLNEAVQKVG
jgi:hypothetical protein